MQGVSFRCLEASHLYASCVALALLQRSCRSHVAVKLEIETERISELWVKHHQALICSVLCAGLDGSGCVGIGCQWVFLLVTLIVASTLGQPAGTHVLAVGLVGSRFGLWAFDLAVSQMLQERVPNEQLGMRLVPCRDLLSVSVVRCPPKLCLKIYMY